MGYLMHCGAKKDKGAELNNSVVYFQGITVLKQSTWSGFMCKKMMKAV